MLAAAVAVPGAVSGGVWGGEGGSSGGSTGGVVASGVSGDVGAAVGAAAVASAEAWRLVSPIREPAGIICIWSIQGSISVVPAPIQAFAPIFPAPTTSTPARP